MLGAPLPFSVRAADETLLLACGQVIHDEEQLGELFARGALVEAAELAAIQQRTAPRSTPGVTADTPAAKLPALWEHCTDKVRSALAAVPEELRRALGDAGTQLLALIDRAPNVALAQVVREQSAGDAHYGISHSINAATACVAAARHLQWSAEDQRRAFDAALTMNVSMLDMQARLATQVSPLTTGQRNAIQEHPTRSAELLAQAGVDDELWLDAVRQHHEQGDGSGYPSGRFDVCELASLLRFADVYTALMSARSNRPAMTAQQAGRELYQLAGDSPLGQAVIKSFGIFPPGSCVRLASGEMGVVAGNGEKAYHPRVAAMTTTDGAPRLTPVMRNSAHSEHAVVALLPMQAMPMRISQQAVAGIIAAA